MRLVVACRALHLNADGLERALADRRGLALDLDTVESGHALLQRRLELGERHVFGKGRPLLRASRELDERVQQQLVERDGRWVKVGQPRSDAAPRGGRGRRRGRAVNEFELGDGVDDGTGCGRARAVGLELFHRERADGERAERVEAVCGERGGNLHSGRVLGHPARANEPCAHYVGRVPGEHFGERRSVCLGHSEL